MFRWSFARGAAAPPEPRGPAPPLVIPVELDTAEARAGLAGLRQSIGETIALTDVLRERLERLGIRPELF